MEVLLMDVNRVKEPHRRLVQERLPARWERLLRYRFEEDRARSVAAGFLLLSWQPDLSETSIEMGKYGKPDLTSGRHFSLSHSGQYAMLAWDEQPVGCDVEAVRHFPHKHLQRIFTQPERTWMGDSDRRFTALWTMKESLIKENGQGLSFAMDAITLTPVLCEGGYAATWQGKEIFTVEGGEYFFSCAGASRWTGAYTFVE